MSNSAQFIEYSPKKERGAQWDMQISGHASGPAKPSEAGTRRAYEPPQVIVIGKIRDVTTGNASSGNADANSQYYW